MRIHPLRFGQLGARRFQQPADVEHGHAVARGVLRKPLFLHGGDDQIGDADRGRARAEEQDSLLGQRRIDDLQRRLQPCERDAGRALDIVVVAEHFVGISFEHTDCICALPVLEVDAAAGKDLLHRLDEFFDDLVQILVGGRLFTQTEIERIGAERVVGRADVEQNRQQRRQAGSTAAHAV